MRIKLREHWDGGEGMNNLSSAFAGQITKYLDWRVALGYSRDTDGRVLARFDKYCASNHSDARELTRQIVCGWMDSESAGIPNKTTAIRNFSKYLQAHGYEAYEYPASGQRREKGPVVPNIFTGDELRALFAAIDKLQPSLNHPYLPIILPAMLRLIYSCGLRPNEGRDLLSENVNLDTGEILITKTKNKKDRYV